MQNGSGAMRLSAAVKAAFRFASAGRSNHPRMARGGRKPSPLLIAAAVCAALALASLALPSGPTYDPYSWLIWGRDLAHLDLVTSSGGTSWKPLPALIAAVLSPLGGGAADGWLVVARAGALFALFMSFRLAWRLAPHRARLIAGLVAAASLALTWQFLRRSAIGDAEGLCAAMGLLAIDRHLDQRHGQAFWLLVLASLIRVEMWPFAALYGAWLWLGGRVRRLALAAGALLIPVLWFGGDWLGSGSLTTAAGRARHPVPGSAGMSTHPARQVLAEAYGMLPRPAVAGVVVALLFVLARRGQRTTLVLAACATAWTAIVAVMAQRGYAGLPRFLFPAVALYAVVAGIGLGSLVDALNAWAARRLDSERRGADAAGRGSQVGRMRTAGVVIAIAACTAFAFGAAPNAELLPTDAAAIDKIADMDAGLASAVTEAGGSGVVLRCGAPVTPWYTVTALEWDLDVNAGTVHDQRAMPSGRLVRFSPHGTDWNVRSGVCPKLS